MPFTLPLVIVTHGASLVAVQLPQAFGANTVTVTAPPLPETAGGSPFIENVHTSDGTGTKGGHSLRTRALPLSATTIDPSGATATPVGELNSATRASPPSPENDTFPAPAIVVMIPPRIRRIRDKPVSAMRMSPAGPAATPNNHPSCAAVAG